jgi:hypothetical protein
VTVMKPLCLKNVEWVTNVQRMTIAPMLVEAVGV